MTHKRTWLALGALLAAIIGGTVWAAEQEKQAPKEQTLPPAYPQAIDTAKPTVCPSAYIDALRDWNRDNMQMRGFSGGAIPPSKTQQIESSDRCAAKEQEKTCCEDKCCETAKEKTCCEDKCYEVAKEKTCCTDGKCCGCCEKSKDKQGITVVPVTPGSSFQVLVTPTTPAMTYEIPVAPPAPSCPAMPPLPVQGCGSSWASTTVPQPTQPMQYTPVSPYVPTAYPVGPPAPTPTAYPAVTPLPPAPTCAVPAQCNPWKIRAVVEKDHTCLEMQVNAGGEETRACCENMVLKIGNESLKVAVADKQVQVHGSFVKGSADTVTRNSADGSIFLEGHVKLKYEKGGQKAEVSAERVVVGVADGRLEVKPVPPEQQQVFSFWIGLNR